MSRKASSTITSGAAVLTIAWLGSLIPASGQAPTAGKSAPKAATTAPALTRTPDGQPDIQGIYGRRGIHGLANEERESNGPRGADDPLEDNAYSAPPGQERVRNNRAPNDQNFNQGGAVGPVPTAGPPPVEPRVLGLVDKVLPWKPEE